MTEIWQKICTIVAHWLAVLLQWLGLAPDSASAAPEEPGWDTDPTDSEDDSHTDQE